MQSLTPFDLLVESKLLRKRGATRGIRLICYDSLIAYLNSLTAELAEA